MTSIATSWAMGSSGVHKEGSAHNPLNLSEILMLDEVGNGGKPDEVKDDGKPDFLDNPNLAPETVVLKLD